MNIGITLMNKTLLAVAILSTLSFSSVAQSYKAGDILVRGGATMVEPDDNKANVKLDGANSGLKVSVDDDTQIGLNFVYFFDSNWAVELLAATPFEHDIKLHAGDEESTLATVEHLPPTLSALYYFDVNGPFKPYVGAGVNYTIFFSEDFNSTYKDAGFSDLELDDSFGFAAQIGADYEINNKWHINASVRYISISTDADFKVGGAVKGSSEADIDPMVYSIMLGYKF